MDIRSYQMFVSLAETRHFGKTAELTHLSASAITRQLQRLEQQVGQQLVERDNRQVRLTPAGRHFLGYAQQAVDNWQQLRRELQGADQYLSGEISVYGSVTASYSILTAILPQLRLHYPGIELKLRTGDQADGIERVLAGVDDGAIVAQPKRLPEKLAFLPLQTTPLHLIAPVLDNPLSQLLARHQALQCEPDWNQIPVILAEFGLARERFLQRLKAIGVTPPIYAQVAGHEAVVAMVSLGFGIAVVPELVIHHSPAQATIQTLPWLTDLEPFALGLCVLKARLKDPLLKAFWQCAQPDFNYPEN